MTKDVFLSMAVAIIVGVLAATSSMFGLKIYVVIFGICIFILLYILNRNLEKTMMALFSLLLPFNILYTRVTVAEYHVGGAKPYFVFDVIWVCIIYFFIKIIQNRKNLRFNKDLFVVIIYFFITLISSTWAINMKASIYEVVRLATFIIMYIYFSRIKTMDDALIMFNYILIGLIAQFLIGLLQFMTNGSIGLYFLGESNSAFRVGVSGYEKGISGTFGHPSSLAFYSLFIFIWALYIDRINKLIQRLLIFVSFTIIILTASRTVLLLVLLGCIPKINDILRGMSIKKIIKIIMFLIMILLAILILKDQLFIVINRFINSDFTEQVDNRLNHWELALYFIELKPILGWGINNYVDLAKSMFPVSFYNDFFLQNPVHNVYLLYAVEIGVIGVAFFVLLILKNFFYVYKIRKRCDNASDMKSITGLTISILLYAIYNMQGWAGIQTRTMYMFWIASALIYNMTSKYISKNSSLDS